MIKTYAFIIFIFSTLYITSSNTVNITDVFFDKKLDIIFHKGKLYLPKLHPLIPNEVPESPEKNENHNPPPHNPSHDTQGHGHGHAEHEHGHELVSGETFWIYIFIIFCKK